MRLRLLPARASEQGNVIGFVCILLASERDTLSSVQSRIVYIYIYTKYSTLPSGISVYIVPKVGIFPEAGGRGKYSLPRVQYMPIFHKEGF